MGAYERRKGRRGENEFVAKLNFHGYDAERISEAGSPGPDVKAFNGRHIEVKRRKELPATLKRWMRDVPIAAVREDLGHWILCMSMETLLDIIEEYADGEI